MKKLLLYVVVATFIVTTATMIFCTVFTAIQQNSMYQTAETDPQLLVYKELGDELKAGEEEWKKVNNVTGDISSEYAGLYISGFAISAQLNFAMYYFYALAAGVVIGLLAYFVFGRKKLSNE
jgi:hypothetical protein